jgi:aminoglycoside phosphotransferase (APT) family kinase protein
MTTPDLTTADFREELRAVLARELADDDLEFESLSRRGEGYSWETYLLTTRSGRSGRVERYAVKREPVAGLVGDYDVQLEVDLLEAARHEFGCPVPGVIAHVPSEGDQRGFYVMEMVDGVVPMPWNVKKLVPDADERRAIGLELAGIMARIHVKDVADLQIGSMTPPVDGGTTGADETAKWRASYEEVTRLRLPLLDLAFAWLAHSAGAVSGRVSLVHNDLRVGNVIVSEGRVAAVLDWETAEYTDPVADLAKFNLPTFRGRSSLASGLVEWDEFLAAYEAVSGWRPTEAALDYWTVLEITKAAVGCLRGLHYVDAGLSTDIRYATMGNQIHHFLKWLIELYENGTWGRAS